MSSDMSRGMSVASFVTAPSRPASALPPPAGRQAQDQPRWYLNGQQPVPRLPNPNRRPYSGYDSSSFSIPGDAGGMASLSRITESSSTIEAANGEADNRGSSPANAQTPKLDKDQLVIAVMGATGTGKSTFISKLTQQHVKIGHTLESCTSDIEVYQCIVGGKSVMLVDTPGFDDTDRPDTEILQSLAEWMKVAGGAGMKFSGIIYLHSIDDNRIRGSSLSNLRLFRALCGTPNLNKVIIATTKWEITKPEDARARYQELQKPDGRWAAFIASGTGITCLFNNRSSAINLVNMALSKNPEPFAPQLQQEMMEGKELGSTQVGLELNHALADLQAKLQAEIDAIRKEYEDAKQENATLNEDLMTALHARERVLVDSIRNSRISQERLNARSVKYEQKIAALRNDSERSARQLAALQQQQLAMQDRDRETASAMQRQIDEARQIASDANKQFMMLQAKFNTLRKNYRGLFASRWACHNCGERTGRHGKWRCPRCNMNHNNMWARR